MGYINSNSLFCSQETCSAKLKFMFRSKLIQVDLRYDKDVNGIVTFGSVCMVYFTPACKTFIIPNFLIILLDE